MNTSRKFNIETENGGLQIKISVFEFSRVYK